MPTSLLLTAAPVVSMEQVNALLEAQGLSAADPAAVATGSGALMPGALSAGAYDVAVLVASAPGHHTVSLLGQLSAALKPGGRLVVQEPGTSEANLGKLLLLSGFTGAAPAPGGGLSAQKPAWETGARAAIALKPRGGGGAAAAAPSSKAATWTLAADEDGDEELVDDDALLTEEDLQRPAAAAANDDCEVGAAGKKACKNCTCGRAEGDAPQELTKDMLENPTSGCGSCGLGDAFRCAGCPYRGLPSFEMGKKIELPSDFLAVDLYRPHAPPAVLGYDQCAEVASESFYAAGAAGRPVSQHDVAVASAMEARGFLSALYNHAAAGGGDPLPHTIVRTASNLDSLMPVYRSAANQTVWLAGATQALDLDAGYAYAIGTASTAVLSLLRQRCLAGGATPAGCTFVL
ncbi:anamorsin-like protein [Micractinium conductrix]|uniref:Anamorsin homolog n=1 Tax=Micractinium conductrix TaxID=554055 RepID=A0A2P6VI63_9CHLO|nr:anamorsin-like protein [Micractinium conductrix]|eukprot:PSC73770.1 anamorsin-like protein [Micractinium conductrix]